MSDAQIAQELDLNVSDAQAMCQLLRKMIDKKTTPVLEGAVECDEVYIVAGHKGQPENVSAAGGTLTKNTMEGFLVFTTIMVTPTSGYFTRSFTALSQFL